MEVATPLSLDRHVGWVFNGPPVKQNWHTSQPPREATTVVDDR